LDLIAFRRGLPRQLFINGDADALVTYNVSDFAVAADRFGVLVLRPVDVLKKVKP